MRVWLLIAVAFASNGCGYALAGRGSFLPSYIRVVGIPPIENRTPVQQIELVLTEKVRTEFIGRGKYRVATEATGADAVLAAEVMSISVQPVAFNQQQIASRYQFIMTMKATFTDTRTNMVLWSNDALVFREEYDLNTVAGSTVIDAGTFFDQERGSIDRIATDVARSVVTAILEAF
jgi:outer membrane lipopolysaccharide assembly protein LptE/RlpB